MLHWCLEAPPETERVWGGLCSKTISYTTTCHVKENATITETLQYATPGVLAVSVADNIAYSPFSIRTWKINPDRWSAYVETVEGKTIGQATFEFEVK